MTGIIKDSGEVRRTGMTQEGQRVGDKDENEVKIIFRKGEGLR